MDAERAPCAGDVLPPEHLRWERDATLRISDAANPGNSSSCALYLPLPMEIREGERRESGSAGCGHGNFGSTGSSEHQLPPQHLHQEEPMNRCLPSKLGGKRCHAPSPLTGGGGTGGCPLQKAVPPPWQTRRNFPERFPPLFTLHIISVFVQRVPRCHRAPLRRAAAPRAPCSYRERGPRRGQPRWPQIPGPSAFGRPSSAKSCPGPPAWPGIWPAPRPRSDPMPRISPASPVRSTT